MKCKVYKIISFVCSMILFFNLQVYSLASTTSGSEYYNWTAGEKFTYFLLNGMNILGDGYSMIIGADDADDVWQDFFDFVSLEYLEENQTFDEWCLSNTSWYYDNSGIQNENTVTGFSMTPTMADALQLTVNNYVAENPLTYTLCYIYSYNFIDTSTFGNIAPYNSLKNFISQQDGYVLVNYGSFKLNSSEHGYMIYVIPKSLNMGLYGSVSSGSFTNVQMSVNWKSSQYLNQMSSEIKAYYMNESGTITEGVTNFNQWRVASIKNNNSLAFNSTNVQFTMFSNLPKNEAIYVYSTLNAYKQYNSGSPQPYYLGSDFGTHKTNYSVSSFPSSNNSYYNQVTNNVQSGWSAEQVLELVDKIISSGGGSGSGSGSSDSDSLDLGWLGKIGGVIVKIVNAIASVITDIIDGIATALIGEDGTGGIVGTLKTILHNVVELVTEDFTDFMSEIFGFLPPEISTILIAGITLSVFFGVIKILRK